MIPSFTISAGWIVKMPSRSQRRAPLTVTPSPGMSTTMRPSRPSSKRGTAIARSVTRLIRAMTTRKTRPTANHISWRFKKYAESPKRFCAITALAL